MPSTRLCLVVSVMGLFALVILPESHAQTIWNGGVGNWSDAADWSTGVVPNGSTVDVRIDNGNQTASFVTFDLTSGSVGALIVDANDSLVIGGALTSHFATLSNGSLNLNPGGTLDTHGLLNNGGVGNNGGVINNSGTFNNSGTMFNSYNSYGGTINNNRGGTIDNSGIITMEEFSGGGTVNNYNGGTINNSGGLYTHAGGITNYAGGTINNTAPGLIYYAYAGWLSNSGTINNFSAMQGYDSGLYNFQGTINNYGGLSSSSSARILNSGTINNFGYLTSNSYASISNDGVVNNYGMLDNSDNSTVSNFVGGTINNVGTVNEYFNSTITSAGTMTNIGTINIYSSLLENSGTLTSPGSINIHNDGAYLQSSGFTVIDGLFTSETPIQINGGILSGSGLIQGDVRMGGTLAPGDSPGILTIQGNYTQLVSGRFAEEIAGLQVGTDYDQLGVVGAVFLDGFLDLTLLNGFVPAIGSTFDILTFTPGELTGTFAGINGFIASDERWVVIYDNQDGLVELEAAAAPEPSSFLLLGSGLLGLAGMLRRRGVRV